MLEYDDDALELLPGETVVGRHLDCRLRFNDPTISRRHLRFVVFSNRLMVEECGSTNGTLLNGEPLTETTQLEQGDEVRVGSRLLRVNIITDLHADAAFDEQTLDGETGWAQSTTRDRRPTPSKGVISTDAVWSRATLPEEHICPRCRTRSGIEINSCPSCGYEWPAGRPVVVTQRIDIRKLQERRQHIRVTVDMPVFYTSDLLCFDATARDLSLGGVFLATDLLDEVTTDCRVTLLPDGARAVTLEGIVRRVVTAHVGQQGRPPGMGIEFMNLASADKDWLTTVVDRHKANA